MGNALLHDGGHAYKPSKKRIGGARVFLDSSFVEIWAAPPMLETSCQRSVNAVIVTNRNKIVYFSNKFDGGSMANVFISHRRSDTNKAERLAQEIRRAGHRIWFDEWEIGIGDSIVDRMNQGLSGSAYVVVC